MLSPRETLRSDHWTHYGQTVGDTMVGLSETLRSDLGRQRSVSFGLPDWRGWGMLRLPKPAFSC